MMKSLADKIDRDLIRYLPGLNGLLAVFTIFAMLIFIAGKGRCDTGPPVSAGQGTRYSLFALRSMGNGNLDPSGNPVRSTPWEILVTTPSGGIPFGSAENSPSLFVQRGSVNNGGYSLLAELGALQLPALPPHFRDFIYRGVRMSLGSEFSGSSVKFAAFTATSNGIAGRGQPVSVGREYVIAGATGEIGFFADKARVKTSFYSADEKPGVPIYNLPCKLHSGDGAEVSATIDPFAGKILFETAISSSGTGEYSSVGLRDVRQTAYSLRIGGKSGIFGYNAGIEHKVSESTFSATGITITDRDRYSAGSTVERSGSILGLDMFLLRSGIIGSGTRQNETTVEGKLAYSYKGIEELPVSLKFTKTIDTVNWGQGGDNFSKSETDAVSGDIRYLEGILSCDLTGKLSRRKDLVRQRAEQSVADLSFTPQLVLDDLSIAHSVSMHRLYLYGDNNRTDSYNIKLGAKGRLPETMLDYEINGGFLRTASTSTESVKDSVTTRFRISTPIPQLFDGWKPPSLGVNGEYRNFLNPAFGPDNFSLFFSIENS